MAGRRLLAAFAKENPRATFVEIGANDGAQHDHLRSCILSLDWRGVMVEPVPYVFERLRRNYAHLSRVALENGAVGNQDGSLPFYYLVDASSAERRRLPDWYDGIGSFSRETVMSHEPNIPDIADRLRSVEVPTLTFDSLCRKHGIEHVDLLVVDTEGYDWEIISQIDFSSWRPQLVIYEHFHFSPDVRAECASYLGAHGYELMEEGFDTFCLNRTEANDALLRSWRQLEPAVRAVFKHEERR